MSSSPILKEYYAKYLRDIRCLSESSVKHYIDALNSISNFLIRKNVMKTDIFAITDAERLETIQEILLSDPEFRAKDSRGHHMYSAGFHNYCRFANGEDFSAIQNKSVSVDIPILVKTSVSVSQRNRWSRSTIIRRQSIAMADYLCEIDSGHESFIAESSHHRYMEGHHAIPTYLQDRFAYSLDVYANVVCLCPLCHRRIHYGLKQDRIAMIQQIYASRAERLAKSGICVSADDFVALSMERN